ncbi:MAG: PAS domain S-box protein, partial [Gemmatimonadetes bacterium]|nr:PAS domain S-box protein [Gemmatimonadota bacterium]
MFSPPNIIAAAGTPGERVVRERRSLVTLRSTDPASLGAEITGTGRRSESVIRTPILRGDDVVGFLSVQSYTPDLYTSQDVQVTEAIASLASTALSNVELLAERSAVEEALRGAERDAQNMADRMRAVASAAAGVVAADSLDALHDVLRDACRKVISFDAFTFALYDATTDELHFLLGYDGDVITPADTISAKGVPAEKVIRERRSLVTLKASDPNAAGAKLMGTGRRSESIIRSPILSGEDVLGVLAVHSYTPDLYTPHDVEVLETVTSLAATAIKKVRLASERAAAEEALRASEENYRTVFDSSNEGIYIHDLETGAILDVNRTASQLHGYTEEEFRTQGPAILGTGQAPYDLASAIGYLKAAAAGEPQLFEWQIRHRSGRITWVEVSLRRISVNGRDRILATARNIHDRKMAEAELQTAYAELERRVEERTAELKRSEEYFRSLLENTSDIVTVLDKEGALLYQSPAMQRELGWRPEEMLGRNA